MKIWIIMTCYNHEKYIAEAIESVIQQSYTDRELYIGNDASTDNTESIINKYASYDKRIKIWTHKENIWLVENMNFLFSKITSDTEYITFLEGDDLYPQDTLFNKLLIFKKTSVDAVVSQAKIIHLEKRHYANIQVKNKKSKAKYEIKIWNDQLILWRLHSPFTSFWSVMMRYSVFKENVPFDNLESQEKVFVPFDLLVRYITLYGKNIALSKDIWLIYRIHWSNQSGRKYIKKALHQRVLIYEYILSKSNHNTRLIEYYKRLTESKIDLLEKKYSAGLKKFFTTCLEKPLDNILYKITIIGSTLLNICKIYYQDR